METFKDKTSGLIRQSKNSHHQDCNSNQHAQAKLKTASLAALVTTPQTNVIANPITSLPNQLKSSINHQKVSHIQELTHAYEDDGENDTQVAQSNQSIHSARSGTFNLHLDNLHLSYKTYHNQEQQNHSALFNNTQSTPVTLLAQALSVRPEVLVDSALHVEIENFNVSPNQVKGKTPNHLTLKQGAGAESVAQSRSELCTELSTFSGKDDGKGAGKATDKAKTEFVLELGAIDCGAGAEYALQGQSCVVSGKGSGEIEDNDKAKVRAGVGSDVGINSWVAPGALIVRSKQELVRCIDSGMDLSRCDISGLDDLSYVFYKRNLPQARWQQIKQWDTRNVQNFSHMFEGSNLGSIELSAWDMQSALDLSYMFCDCSRFNANLNSWNVSGVKSLAHTFHNAVSFKGDISKWDTHNVLTMESLLQGARKFNCDLRGWRVNQVINWNHAFAQTLSFCKLGATLGEWHFDAARSVRFMLAYTQTQIPDRLDFPQAFSLEGLFYHSKNSVRSLKQLCAPMARNLAWVFAECNSVNANLTIVCPQAQRLDYMFAYIPDLTLLGSKLWQLGKIGQNLVGDGNVHHILAKEDTLDFISGHIGSSSDCLSVTSSCSAPALGSGDDMKGKSAHPMTMVGMFQNVKHLQANFQNWDISSVTNMARMFKNSGFTQGLSSWQPINATNMREMFAGARKFNDKLSHWSVDKVLDFERMFFMTPNFKGNLSNWHVHPQADTHYMFKDSGILNGNLPDIGQTNFSDLSELTGQTKYQYCKKRIDKIDQDKLATMQAFHNAFSTSQSQDQFQAGFTSDSKKASTEPSPVQPDSKLTSDSMSGLLSGLVNMLQQSTHYHLEHFKPSLPETTLKIPAVNSQPSHQKRRKPAKNDTLPQSKSAAWAHRL